MRQRLFAEFTHEGRVGLSPRLPQTPIGQVELIPGKLSQGRLPLAHTPITPTIALYTTLVRGFDIYPVIQIGPKGRETAIALRGDLIAPKAGPSKGELIVED